MYEVVVIYLNSTYIKHSTYTPFQFKYSEIKYHDFIQLMIILLSVFLLFLPMNQIKISLLYAHWNIDWYIQ